MTDLKPTPELIATARRCFTGSWTVGPDGGIEVGTNLHLAELVGAGYAQLRYVSATAQINGREDHWRLTEAGEKWLAQHDPGFSRA